MTAEARRADVWSALGVLTAWPRRRWFAVSVLVVPLVAVYASVPGQVISAGWVVADFVAGLMAALVLASYVPRPGSSWLLEVGAQDAGIAVVATGLLGVGLVQRLADAQACRLPTAPAAPDSEVGSAPR